MNVYLDHKGSIGWHQDRTSNLVSGKVSSFSFALHARDRTSQLATMEFRVKGDKSVERVALYHGTRVDFDAKQEVELCREHRVPKTLHPRINLTFRHVR